MTYQDDDFILVGNFGRPIGLKGSIKLNSFTRPPENIKSYNSFFIKESSQFIELEVIKITTSGKNLIIFMNRSFVPKTSSWRAGRTERFYRAPPLSSSFIKRI